jgi:apolipoprotein N-acyltransferase
LKILFWKNRAPLTAEEKILRRKDRLLLIISGIFLGISFPPFPFPFTIFMLIGLVPYFLVLEKKEKLIEMNKASYLMAFIFGLITIYWVGSWQKESDPFLMISGGLLLFVNPVFFMIPTTLLYFSRKIFSRRATLFLFPLFWVTYEYLYMTTQLSFPWLTLGNGLPHFITFIQIADIVGTLGLSLLVVYINVFFYKAISFYPNRKKNAYIYFIVGLIFIVTILIYGAYQLKTFKTTDNTIRVGLIQPNIDPWNKWSGVSMEQLTHNYLDMSRQAVDKGAKLIVWPETALPDFLLIGTFRNSLDSIYNFTRQNNIFLLTGMPDIRYDKKGPDLPPDSKYSAAGDFYYRTYNAIFLFSPYTSEIQRYGKMKLVPFGEHVPYSDTFPFLGDLIKWGVGITGWNIGKDTLVFKLPIKIKNATEDTLKLNGLVCYESIYPDFVAEFSNKGAQLIAVVTNDSWYGNSSGPYQHKEISVLRAVENRKSVLRAANGGISCFINPLGITVDQSKMFTKDILVEDVPIESGRSFYTKTHLVIPTLCSVFSLWLVGIVILKKMKEKFNL